MSQLATEAVRFGLQLIVALVAARLAVKWALKRYKSEKTWERRLTAYVDAVTSISEMRLVIGQWLDHLDTSPLVSSDTERKLNERYHEVKRKLDSATAAALLLLPRSASELLSKVDVDMEVISRAADRHTRLNHQYSLLDDALSQLIALGRTDLR